MEHLSEEEEIKKILSIIKEDGEYAWSNSWRYHRFCFLRT